MLLVLLASACAAGDGGPTDGPTPGDTTVTSVAVSPSGAILTLGDTARFTATGRSAASDSHPIVPGWAATGGSVDHTGRYTATTLGVFRLIARARNQGGAADTARLDVLAAPVDSLEISPASAVLAPGQNQPFAVTARLTDGSTAVVPVRWTATAGSVSDSGRYQAAAAGEHLVVAATEDGAYADTARVTVAAPAGGLAGECAVPQPGWIWCDDFDQDRLGSYFEYEDENGSFVRAAGVGNAGSHGMRARFAQGQVSAGALHLAVGRTPQPAFRSVDGGTADHRELYWRVYVRHQPGWTGGGGDKLSRAFIFASSTSWAQAMIAHVWSGNSTTRDYLVIDPASGTDAQGNLRTTKYNDFANLRWLGAARSRTPLFDAAHVGRWYCIEARVKLNDPGQSNGLFEVWVDGVSEARRSGLNWAGSYSRYGLNAVYLENYWNAGSPRAQERYFDNFVVSTRPIGC